MKRLAILGNHLPRQCGIATFTTHLADALATDLPEVDSFVLAMNDAGRRHSYPSRVRFEIAQGDLGSYRRAADFLNVNHVDVLSVQHEYGIFGGKAGAHVIALLHELRMPIVTTLHTVLSAPNPAQRAVIDELARLSARLVVMSASGRDLLTRVHGISADQIDLIPHGIPHVPVESSRPALNTVCARVRPIGRDGTTLLLRRVEDRRGHSHLCAARSRNGIDMSWPTPRSAEEDPVWRCWISRPPSTASCGVTPGSLGPRRRTNAKATSATSYFLVATRSRW